MLPAREMTWESSSPSTINCGAKPTNMESPGFQLARQRQDIGLRAPHPRERIPSPPRIILGRRTGDEFEAGPSHPPVAESIPQAILQPLPVLEDLDLGELTIAIYIDSSSEEDT
ncbi:hypothetical protein SASPL_107556 [Salvia splendens]|uniref:Uncharacterized protein n=1 Tax=Salvia splendens TaxID=180675 RepID=A0A8X8YDM9_SALSN|nr:hypothetical protein SASPL_107556 [Salvia splendens]